MEAIMHHQDQHKQSPVTQKQEAQARKIHMHRRMAGAYHTHNVTRMFKRHQLGCNDFLPTDVCLGAAINTWRVTCSDAPEGRVLVTHVVGTDIQCDCVDYPREYVCRECKICIHMYTCSCREVEEFPALICKHIHAAVQHGEGVIQKEDIYKHIITPHRTPGHKWPNPIIYRFKISGGKRGSIKTLVPLSSESIVVNGIIVNDEPLSEIFEPSASWK